MDTSTPRYGGGDGRSPQAVYWRRRFLALVGGLAVLALLAWASSGMFDGIGIQTAAGASGLQARATGSRVGPGAKGPDGKDAAGRTGAAGTGRSGGGSQSGSSGGPSGRGGRGADAAAGGHGRGADRGAGAGRGKSTGRATARGDGGAGRGSSPTGRRTRTARAARLRTCPAHDVVLSLFATQRRYGLGQVPEFDVDVVSTAARPCTFDVGPRFLTLVIKSGAVSVWDSADCVTGPGSLSTELVRGVPTVLPMSWDRARSAPGCTGTQSAAPDGRYVAVATDGDHLSDTQTFRLAIYR
jgi:hypothetical protein